MKHKHLFQVGMINSWAVLAIAGMAMFLIAGSLAIWTYSLYVEQKSDVDGRIKVAVAEAKKEQAEADHKKYQEDNKNPRLEFVGPAEYGRVSFMYPKTWSVYVEKDGSDRGDYVAYFHPVTVPPTKKKESRYVLRLEILNKDFDTVLGSYKELLKKGDLVSSTPEYNGVATTRLDGAFSKDLRGAVVLTRVRDKTVRISTDADSFKPDLQAVLDTIKYVQ